jgi:hypothetical protein
MNNKVNSYFERPHPNIKKVLGCPQKEAENCNHLYMRNILNFITIIGSTALRGP